MKGTLNFANRRGTVAWKIIYTKLLLSAIAVKTFFFFNLKAPVFHGDLFSPPDTFCCSGLAVEVLFLFNLHPKNRLAGVPLEAKCRVVYARRTLAQFLLGVFFTLMAFILV